MRTIRARAFVFVGLVALAAASACGHFELPPARETFGADAEVAHGRLIVREGVAIADVSGSPEEIGGALAALLARPLGELLATWARLDAVRSLVASPPDIATFEPDVPRDHRRELAALARALGQDERELLRLNAVLDGCGCTAFVASGAATRTGALVVGRNMDFTPAETLGADTLVAIVRPSGKRAFAAIGWPGVTSVITGMNDAGLCAAVLVNEGAAPPRPGEPLGYLVREILETCGSVGEARALFVARTGARAVASGHFVFLADARDACVVSRDAPERFAERSVLSCSNGPIDASSRQHDARAVALAAILEQQCGRIDAELARRIVGAVYCRRSNAQAMVFEPAARVVSLARGTTFAPAALGAWSRIDLSRALAPERGEPRVEPARRVAPFSHYTGVE